MARGRAWCRRLPDVTSGSEPAPEVSEPAPTVARQRWRLVLARPADATGLAGRDVTDAWESALERSGLPVHRPTGRSRGRVAFGAPLPAGMAAERELADIVLTDLLPTWRVREGIARCLVDAWRLIDLYDVWLGMPPLAGQVVAADYRIELDDADASACPRGRRIAPPGRDADEGATEGHRGGSV